MYSYGEQKTERMKYVWIDGSLLYLSLILHLYDVLYDEKCDAVLNSSNYSKYALVSNIKGYQICPFKHITS